jgi:hypothetical protein
MIAERSELYDFTPTPERLATAREILERHIRVCVPEPCCQWCFQAWPCPDARWAQRIQECGRAARLLV